MRTLNAPSLTSHQLLTNPTLLTAPLEQEGLVIISELESATQLVALSRGLGPLLIQEDTDHQGVKAVTAAASMAGSELHTDRASMVDPPPLVWIYCAKQASHGGESIFVDMARVVEDLSSAEPALLQQLCSPQSVCFGIGELAALTQLLSCDEHGRWIVRFRFDRWGFFSPHIIDVLPTLWASIREHTRALRLVDGQSYLVQNGRWLHGALPSMDGPRHIYRTMIYPDDPRHKLGWDAR